MKINSLIQILLFSLVFFFYGQNSFVFSNDLPQELFQFFSLKTHFIQEKKLKAFQQTLKVEGTLSVLKPSYILWKANSPVQYTLLIRDQEVTYQDEDMDKPKIFSVSQNPVLKESLPLFEILLCHKQKDLEKIFKVDSFVQNESETEMTLSPKSEMAKSLFRTILLRINRKDGKLSQIEFREENGDSSLISFSDTKYDLQLMPQDFKLN